MKLTFGAFKEAYNGSGIYWAGCYNIEGDGEFRTIGEARAQIDKNNAAYALRELNARLTAVRQGAIACVSANYCKRRLTMTPKANRRSTTNFA